MDELDMRSTRIDGTVRYHDPPCCGDAGNGDIAPIADALLQRVIFVCPVQLDGIPVAKGLYFPLSKMSTNCLIMKRVARVDQSRVHVDMICRGPTCECLLIQRKADVCFTGHVLQGIYAWLNGPGD